LTLSPGTKLGPYEILAPLGAGGMGEVYRARDTRLERTVAVKVLPAHLSSDPQLRLRFEREARAISTLSHPHICTLFDVGRQDETDYLVMELLEGETLHTRLKKGPLPLEQVLRFGTEIASALAAAHRRGIVHRDLKPGNVMLTKSGVKLLDFGLARLERPGSGAEFDASVAITRSAAEDPLTADRTILGTLPYMAPEQVEGKPTDARTDIFAFGAVLYEMATGRRAFPARTQATLIAEILRTDPLAASSGSAVVPRALSRILATCLKKDPEERWQMAHDLARELGAIQVETTAPGSSPGQARNKSRERVAWALGAVLLALAALWGGRRMRTPTDVHPVRFTVPIPENATLYSFSGPVAISPDGRNLAFFALSEGRYVLFVRPLDSLGNRAIAGTESGSFPFWSPDGRSIGFFAQEKLKKVEVNGGQPQDVCDAPSFATGAWSPRGTILVGTFGKGMQQVSEKGGALSLLTPLDTSREEMSQLWPRFLPDGRQFLYLSASRKEGRGGIYAGSLDSREVKRITDGDSNADYTRSGHLVVVRDGHLTAQAFDTGRLQVTGDAFPLTEEIWWSNIGGGALFSISNNGTLALASPGIQRSQLVWYDREGRRLGALGSPGEHIHLDLSPDGSRVAFERLEPSTGNGQIWLLDLRREITSRFSLVPSFELSPCWSSDGKRIAFSSSRSGLGTALYLKSAMSAGEDEPLPSSGLPMEVPTDWTPDGRYVLFEARSMKTGEDLWALPLGGDRKPFPLLQTPFDESQGRLSPDGRWLAYVSNESGRQEVYVGPFPTAGEKWQVSAAGGMQPRWRRDGRELFYIAADRKLAAVAIKPGTSFEAAAPVALFELRPVRYFDRMDYAVTADGQRFLVNTLVDEARPARITVVTNWKPEAKR
jgi:serine/threonine protein kinase/Tol biopolymer transport system component